MPQNKPENTYTPLPSSPPPDLKQDPAGFQRWVTDLWKSLRSPQLPDGTYEGPARIVVRNGRVARIDVA